MAKIHEIVEFNEKNAFQQTNYNYHFMHVLNVNHQLPIYATSALGFNEKSTLHKI